MAISYKVMDKRKILSVCYHRGLLFSESVHNTAASLRKLLRADDALMRRLPHCFRGNSVLVSSCPLCGGDMWKTTRQTTIQIQWIECKSCHAVADPVVGIVTQLHRA